MPFIPATNVVQAQLIFQGNAQRMQNVIHFKRSDPWDEYTMTTLAANLKSWDDTELSTKRASTISLTAIELRDLTTENGLIYAIEFNPATPGTRTSPALPYNVTIAVSLRSVQAGRSFRGRIYHVGLTVDQVSGNTLLSTAGTGIQATYALLAVDVAESVLSELVILSKFHNNQPRTQAVATPVRTIQVENILDSQRRRLPGRGE